MINTDDKDIDIPPSSVSTTDLQEQITKFKIEIEELLSQSESTLPPQMDEVLTRLQRAEKSASEDDPKAWYELAKAKLIFHKSGAVSMSELADGDVQALRQELYRVWGELNHVQRQKGNVNTTNAADWLNWGEKALEETRPNKSRAMYCIMRARYSLMKAQEFAEWDKWGYFAILLESLYLLGLPIGIFLYSSTMNMPLVDIMTSAMLQVPFYVFVWGFLGGISWCIYSAAYWSKRRLFDRHYLAWYLAHPWISAVLGGAASLLVLGGLSSLGSFRVDTQPGAALLSLISFVTGFSTNVIWKLLDRTVRKALGEKGSTRNVHEEAHEVALKSVED